MKDKHQKHPPLIRPVKGEYHTNEWSIYGTNCSNITKFYQQISESLGTVNTLLVDADHNTESIQHQVQNGIKQFITSKNTNWEHFDDKFQSIASDIVFINGNHYPASRQIVIIDSKKEASLLKRIDQLNDISCVILSEGEEDIYPFILEKITKNTPIFYIHETTNIVEYIKQNIVKPTIKALILAGGKSSRMGEDKSQISYHNGKSQELHLTELCESLGLETYISKDHNYQSQDESQIIKDRFVDLGPFGAILSAQLHAPTIAWLVLACDLPLIDKQSLEFLISNRDKTKIATAYKIDEKSFPEPLIAIYEPRAYNRLLQFLSLGYACPRKMLINSDIKEITIPNPDSAINVNTPEERKKIEQILKN